MKIKQELSGNAIEKFANNYKGFFEPMQDIIDNSVEAGASKIKIYIGLSSDASNRSIIIEDNGYGIDFTTETLKKAFGYGWTEKQNSLNEHGIGFKTAILALGALTYFSSFTKDNEAGFKVLSMVDNEIEPISITKKAVEKNPKYSGTRIEISGVRPSGKNGISLYENTDEDIQEKISDFVLQIGKTFGLRIQNNLNIHCEIENIDTGIVYFNNLIEGHFPKYLNGRHLIERSVREESGLEYDIIAFEQTEDDMAFPIETGMNQRLIYWKDRLILVPSSSDKAYGKVVKDIEFAPMREIILIKKAPNLTTKQTKDGFVINTGFKELISSKEKKLKSLNFHKHFSSKNKHCAAHEKILSELEDELLNNGCAISKNESVGIGLQTDLISRYEKGTKKVLHIFEVKSIAAKPSDINQLVNYAMLARAENPKCILKATLVATSFSKSVTSIINQYNSNKKTYGVEFDYKKVSL